MKVYQLNRLFETKSYVHCTFNKYKFSKRRGLQATPISETQYVHRCIGNIDTKHCSTFKNI